MSPRRARHTTLRRTRVAHHSFDDKLLSTHRFVVILCLFLFPFSTARTQTIDDEVINVRTNFVTVPVVVTDKRNRFVDTLTQNDFALTDNDQPAPLDYFAIGTSQLALTFLLDTSGSMRDLMSQQRDAALALLNLFNNQSRIAVYTFTDTARVVSPLTKNLDDVRRAFLSPLLTARNDARTAIFDAALSTVHSYNTLPQTSGERRIIVLISDGIDSISTVPHAAVIDAANAAGISFYIIYTPLYLPYGEHLLRRRPSRGFQQLAEQTGGKFFQLGNAKTALDPRANDDLTPIFEAIAADLQGQYLLGFYPQTDRAANTHHRLKVKLTTPDAKKLRVRLLRSNYTLLN